MCRRAFLSRFPAGAARFAAQPSAEELTTITIGAALMVGAGIVAMTRAPEHGYALVSIG